MTDRVMKVMWLASFVILLAITSAAFSADWAHWRGTNFDGQITDAPIPTTWHADTGQKKHVIWQTAIPAFGCNTPIIVGDAIFLTSHVDDHDLVLLRVDRQNGNIVWTKTLATSPAPRMTRGKPMRTWQKFHEHHNLASPSCAADADVVVAAFGTGDLCVCRHNGEVLWRKNIPQEFGEFVIWWGYAASPLLVDDCIIISVLQDNLADMPGERLRESYLVAFDKNSGEVKWRVDRTTDSASEYNDAYTTPVLWSRGGRREVIVLGSEMLDAYNPLTGERLWWLRGGLDGNRIVPTPLPCADLGMIFGVRGKREAIIGVKVTGDGALDEQHALKWQHTKNVPDVASMVVADGLLFTVDDGGIACCFDAQTGEQHWQRRLAAGTYFPSLVMAAGNVYYTNTAGVCTIVKASATFEKVAENKIDDEFFASPIAVAGRLYFRGRHYLYCVGE